MFDEVEAEWMKKESKALQRQETPMNDDEEDDDDSSDEIEECIVKVCDRGNIYLLTIIIEI